MTINFERRGTGSPLVLLHGIGHRWQAWAPVIDALAETHDVIAVDAPGFGLSPRLDRSDISSMAARIESFFDELGLKRPHVAGNSMGGLLALELAATGAVASATAISPAGFWKRWERWYAISVLMTIRSTGYLPGPLVRPFVRRPRLRRLSAGMVYGRPDLLDPDALHADLLGMRAGKGFLPVLRHNLPFATYTGQPTVPVTVAWGTRDRILIPAQAHRAMQALPTARHVQLPGCGHVPMNDDPALVTRIILETTTP